MIENEPFEYETDHTRLSRSLFDNLADFIFTWNTIWKSEFEFVEIHKFEAKFYDGFGTNIKFIVYKFCELLSGINLLLHQTWNNSIEF